MRVNVLRSIPDDPLLRQEWNELVWQMERPEVFYTYEWALALQRANFANVRPLLFLGYEGNSLAGVASLAVAQDGSVIFLSGTTADYCDLLSRPHTRGQWCNAVFSELQNLRYSRVNLANLPVDSATASFISKAAAGHGYRTFIRLAYQCTRVVLGRGPKRDLLHHQIAGKKLLHRNLNAMNKDGPVLFSPVVDVEEREAALQNFCKAHITRFLTTGRFSNLIRAERRRFLYELAHELSQRGWLALSRLQVGDQAVAWSYGFRFAGSWFWYQPTFDTKYERFSPGFCLLCKIIENACHTPEIDVVDLGLGAEDYKARFGNDTRQTLHVTLSSSAFTHAKTILRSRASALAKATPAREQAIRALANRIAAVRSRVHERRVGSYFLQLAKRAGNLLLGSEEVFFFQWPNNRIADPLAGNLVLRDLDADIVAAAAMEYSDDRETLAYLLRAAQRLHRGNSQGFALTTENGMPLHLCWQTNFEGFAIAELKQQLKAPHPNAVLIFDCWTPCKVRGHGYFAMATAAVASRATASAQAAWIFGAATNHASLRGIEKAGFGYRFTLGLRRFLGVRGKVAWHGMSTRPSASVLLPSVQGAGDPK